ncbi:CHASE3 domain-containing protein [Streptomyces sp. RM72]|uniref:sensor histidine kinase n=1 Tax=Streptomyces sp. RM72 TaxID=1115510 RepID=UPI001B396AF3|nr:sensor histidine kinase [Streptomyces sp. RM72]MBQ0884755.1 CHASE3 domain-containing protein [Streptomyces sp. RM72]
MTTAPLRPASPRGRGHALTVQGWFLLVLAFMAVMVVAGTAVGAHLLNRTAQVTDQMIDQIQPARAEAYRLQTALVNQETGARGYAITADRQFLAPYTAGKEDEADSAARLGRLLADREELLDDTRAIQRAAASWRRDYADPLVASVRPGDARRADSRAAGRGKEAFDHIRTLFETQNEHLAQARETGHAELVRVRTQRNWVLSALVAAFLLGGVLMAALIRVLVARPLSRLRSASRQVADGDFDEHIAAHGPSDVRSVAQAVEDMRRRVVTELGASQDARQRLVEQAADLDAQAEELRRSNAELEQFAYVASHDLQEPLRKVASFCQLLEKRYGDKLDERGTQYIGFAVDGAKRMQVLINDLLTFSRVGRLNDAHVSVPLDAALDKALANLSTAIEDAGARIERPAKLPEITGDPTLIVMLWQNLIGNAVKFRRPDHPAEIRITCEENPDRTEGPGWRLCVSDNGIGIPEEFTEKVFVIFQRLHGRDAYSGTGIGLALCKKITEHHGGRIWIDTGYTQGTRFCFSLPAPDTVQPEPAPLLEGTSL